MTKLRQGESMYNGNQVLRFDNKYKSSDLGGLSVELTDRKGTGNYDKDRTKFNIEFKSIENNLASTIYKTLNKNNVIYGENKKNINILNGAIITSGPEFFQSLGMKFKESERTYQVGENVGKPILIPDIKSNEDIPNLVKEYFNESYNFLSNYVGIDNIIYASVHFDEDTPHMHFYFTPIVNEVRRKVFETDSKNKTIKKEITDKKGNKKLVPIQKKDLNGNNIYKLEKGNFLNSDQFWKDKGGNTSFAKAQDEYNEFINSKGFNLFRGETGANKHHTNKQEHKLNELTEKNKKLETEYNLNIAKNELEITTNKLVTNVDYDKTLNVNKRKLVGYKEEDVKNLIEYSKNITKENIINKNEIKKQSLEISKLNNEITDFKSNKKIKEKDLIISDLKETITEQKNIISILQNEITNLKDKIEIITNKFKEKLSKAYKAIGYLLGFKNKSNDYDFYEKEIKNINNKHEKNNDFER